MDRLEQLQASLTNQSPDASQVERIEDIRTVALGIGALILEVTPQGRAQSLALTHLEDCVMWAVKAVVLEGKV